MKPEWVTREITMQDVRLAVGEGKLTAHDVLAGCNAEIRRRHLLAAAPSPVFSEEDLERAARAHCFVRSGCLPCKNAKRCIGQQPDLRSMKAALLALNLGPSNG